MDVVSLVLLAILAVIVLSLILGSFFTVSTAQVAVLTRFGKFLRVAEAGLNWKMPFLDSVAGIVSLRVNQIALTMETKTKDNASSPFPSRCRTVSAPSACTTRFTSSPTPWRRSSPMSSRSFSGTYPR